MYACLIVHCMFITIEKVSLLGQFYSSVDLTILVVLVVDNDMVIWIFTATMPRYDDKYANTRLYVGRLSSRTRGRDLERAFSRYGR